MWAKGCILIFILLIIFLVKIILFYGIHKYVCTYKNHKIFLEVDEDDDSKNFVECAMYAGKGLASELWGQQSLKPISYIIIFMKYIS